MFDTFASLLEQILVFYPAVIGAYIAYKVLKIADLSADGTYVLGASVYTRCLIFGPTLAFILSLISGSCAGFVLSRMQRYHTVHPLIAGILIAFMLYSVNFELLTRPNVSLLDQPTVKTLLVPSSWILSLMMLAAVLSFFIVTLLNSSIGLGLRAFGSNFFLMQKFGFSPEKYRSIGLCTSGLCYALSGTLFSQVYGFVDLSMGLGISLIALASVIAGEKITLVLFPFPQKMWAIADILGIFLGACSYFILLYFLMLSGFQPVHFKLFIGIVLYVALQGHQKQNIYLKRR
jgi:putative ABC transport system permease protein